MELTSYHSHAEFVLEGHNPKNYMIWGLHAVMSIDLLVTLMVTTFLRLYELCKNAKEASSPSLSSIPGPYK